MAHYPKVNIGITYRSYVAQLSQSANSNPIANILHNNLGYTPTWSRVDIGRYLLTAGYQNEDFWNENNNKVVVLFNGGRFPSDYIELGMQANARWSREENLVVIVTGIQKLCVSGDGCQSNWTYEDSDDILSDGSGDDFFRATIELRIYD